MNKPVKNLNETGIKPVFTINQATVRLSATHPLNVERVGVERDIPPHDHDYYEVSVVVRGRARNHTADGVQALAPGTVLVIPPGGVHAISQPRGFEAINLYYLAEWVATGWREHWAERGLVPLFLAQVLFRQPLAARPAVFRLSEAEAAAVEGELTEIRGELARARPSLLFVKAALLKLLVRFSRAADRDGADFPAPVWAVVQAIESCVEHGRIFDLHALLRAWPVSPDRGSRIFRRATGLSPQAYYQRRRVQRACALLLDAGRPITAVAMELGYADAAHFSRLFKKHAGLTPRAYRTKYRVGGDRPEPAA